LNLRDAYEKGLDDGVNHRRPWIDLSADQREELKAGYGDDLDALIEMVASTLRGKNE
jgi:hypothetical protein